MLTFLLIVILIGIIYGIIVYKPEFSSKEEGDFYVVTMKLKKKK